MGMHVGRSWRLRVEGRFRLYIVLLRGRMNGAYISIHMVYGLRISVCGEARERDNRACNGSWVHPYIGIVV